MGGVGTNHDSRVAAQSAPIRIAELFNLYPTLASSRAVMPFTLPRVANPTAIFKQRPLPEVAQKLICPSFNGIQPLPPSSSSFCVSRPPPPKYR